MNEELVFFYGGLPFKELKALEFAGHVHADMHITANKPYIMELNAGAGKIEARWPKAEGWRILAGYLAAEPNIVVDAHAQLKGELIGPIGDLCAAVHANHGEKAYKETLLGN